MNRALAAFGAISLVVLLFHVSSAQTPSSKGSAVGERSAIEELNHRTKAFATSPVGQSYRIANWTAVCDNEAINFRVIAGWSDPGSNAPRKYPVLAVAVVEVGSRDVNDPPLQVIVDARDAGNLLQFLWDSDLKAHGLSEKKEITDDLNEEDQVMLKQKDYRRIELLEHPAINFGRSYVPLPSLRASHHMARARPSRPAHNGIDRFLKAHNKWGQSDRTRTGDARGRLRWLFEPNAAPEELLAVWEDERGRKPVIDSPELGVFNPLIVEELPALGPHSSVQILPPGTVRLIRGRLPGWEVFAIGREGLVLADASLTNFEVYILTGDRSKPSTVVYPDKPVNTKGLFGGRGPSWLAAVGIPQEGYTKTRSDELIAWSVCSQDVWRKPRVRPEEPMPLASDPELWAIPPWPAADQK